MLTIKFEEAQPKVKLFKVGDIIAFCNTVYMVIENENRTFSTLLLCDDDGDQNTGYVDYTYNSLVELSKDCDHYDKIHATLSLIKGGM